MNTSSKIPESGPSNPFQWKPASKNNPAPPQAKPKPAPKNDLNERTTETFNEKINHPPNPSTGKKKRFNLTNKLSTSKPQRQDSPPRQKREHNVFWKFKRTRSPEATLPDSDARKNSDPAPTNALHEALRGPTATLEEIQLLVKKGASINARDEQGNTPLHLAVNHDESPGWVLIVEWLLSQGAQPAIVNAQGKTPLHLTAVKGHGLLAHFLVTSDPALLNQPIPGGETALHLAAHYGHLPWLEAVLNGLEKKQVKLLLKQIDEDGKQTLHHACCQGNPKVVTCLLAAGAKVNAKTNYAYTPLHYAARYGLLDVARVLVSAKAKKNIKTQNEQTAQDLAQQYGQQALVDFLSGKITRVPLTPAALFFSDQLPLSCREALSTLRVPQDIVAQCDALIQLAQGFLDNESFRAVMLATQAALTLLEQHSDNKILTKRQEKLMELSQTIEQSFLKACGITNPITFPHDPYQRRLQALREKVHLMAKDDKVDTEEILSTITRSAKMLVADLLNECFSVLGQPPCLFAIISLGSMSRQEMSPYSDLEFAILHPPLKPNDQKVCQNYFRVLTQLLELRVLSFKETEDKLLAYGGSIMPKGFRYDEGGNTPLGSPGLFELIQTPKELARFQSAKSFEELLILSNTLKTVDLIAGEPELVKEYQHQMNLILDSADINPHLPQTKKLREQQSLTLMQGDCEEFKPRLDKQKEDNPFFDIKKELYRLPSQTISNLALYFGITATNTWERIEAMVEKGVLSKEGGERLKQAMRTIGRFRIKVQCHHRCEEEKAFHLDKAPQGATQYYQLTEEDTAALVEVYKVLLPLHKAVETFVQKKDIDCFSQQSFYDDNLITQGEAFAQLLQYEKAREAFQAAVALAPNDTKALMALGSILQDLGYNKEALHYFEQALTIDSKVHGENHPDVAASLNNIGLAWEKLGDAKKALEYHEQALAIKRQVYGENHPDVATSLHNIGTVWDRLGDAKKALEYLEQALSIWHQVYGENHSAVATTLINIGEAWCGVGDAKKALEYFEQALAIYRQECGENHPAVALSLNNIGVVWEKLGDAKKALEYYEQALAMRRQVYGENHPAVAASFNNIGGAWSDLGDAKKVLEYHEQALAIWRQVYGENHPNVATSLNNIGATWLDLGDAKKALEYYEQALAIRRQVYGENHPDLATSLNNIGFAWSDLGDAKKALEFLEKALAIFRQVYEENHPDVATSLNNIGSVWKELGDAEKALEYYEQALAIRRQVYGENHPTVATSLNNIGFALSKLGDAKKALEHYEQALAIYRQVYGENHFDVENTLNNIDFVRSKLAL